MATPNNTLAFCALKRPAMNTRMRATYRMSTHGISALSDALSGRYEIEREVGRGGTATVYLARDSRHERKVAIKFLDPELGAVLGAERFLSEIRVTANLQHPNLLPLSTRSISNRDVTNDDDRLIVIHHRDGSQRAQLVVVENAFRELRARVPR